MQQLGIHSIYRATEGEGVFIGTPQIFVRFQGCSIGCVNCDSMETWDFKESNTSMESAIAQIEELAGNHPYRMKRVSITGGDPLHPKHVPGVVELTRQLKHRGYYVNIEAAGTRVVPQIFDVVDYISFDYKTPSTGVETRLNLLLKLVEQYGGRFQIKSVISDKKDFYYTFDAFQEVQEKFNAPITWCLTPCYEKGEEFPQSRFEQVIALNEEFGGPFRVIGQQHKWIHGPEKTNV